MSPYRATPPDPLRIVHIERLDELVGTVREGIVTGAFERWTRADVSRMATELEELHASTARRVVFTQSTLATLTVVFGALSALASKILPRPWDIVIALFLVAMLIFVGWALAYAKAMEAALARMKDAHGELVRLALTLPVSEVPTRVRIAVESMAGTGIEELATSTIELERMKS